MTPANVLAALRDGEPSRQEELTCRPSNGSTRTSVEQAAALLADGASGLAVAKAGGIDLVDLMKEGIVRPRAGRQPARPFPVSTASASGPSGELRLGALVTLAQICESPDVLAHCPALAEAARHAATPQVRNAATIGGNLLQRPRCWYYRSAHFHQDGRDPAAAALSGENQYHAIFDNTTSAMVHASTPATALAAYRRQRRSEPRRRAHADGAARVVLLPPDARRDRDAAIEPGEILTTVIVPASAAGTRSAYHKQTERESYDWPICDVAVVLRMDGRRRAEASIVMGWVGADASTRGRSRAPAARADRDRGSRPPSRGGGGGRGDAAPEERLQSADSRGRRSAHDPCRGTGRIARAGHAR